MRATSNSSLELKGLPGKGRSLIWSPLDQETVCRAGTPLLTLDPIAAVLDTSEIDLRCAHCYRTAAESDGEKSRLKRCKGCKTSRYCSTECQRLDWAFVHDKECRALQGWRVAAENSIRRDGAGPSSSISTSCPVVIPDTRNRLLSRLLWTDSLHERQQGLASFDDLESHMSTKMQDPSEQAIILRLAQGVLRFAGMGLGLRHDDVPSPTLLRQLGLTSLTGLVKLICQSHTNAFLLTTGDQCAIGLAASPAIAMANHSCRPNAAHSFPWGPSSSFPKVGASKGAMRLVAIRDIKPGEEVTTAYIDVADPYEARTQKLQRDYFFDCVCELCAGDKRKSEAWARRGYSPTPDPRDALWCPRYPACKGWIARPSSGFTGPTTLRCSSCATARQNLDAAELLRQLSLLQRQAKTLLSVATASDSSMSTRELLRLWTESYRPLLEGLAPKMLPSSLPLKEVLHAAKDVLSQLYGGLEAEGAVNSVTADDVIDAGARLAMMDAAALGFALDEATSKSEPALYSRGHPGRGVQLCLAGRWLLSASSPSGCSSYPPSSQSWSRLLSPTLFPVQGPYADAQADSNMSAMETAEVRAKWARAVLEEAERSARLGYGEDVQGGEVGRNARQALKEMDEGRRVTSSASRGRAGK